MQHPKRAPDDLDGEKVGLRYNKMENVPLRQAMGMCKSFLAMLEKHDMRCGELDVHPHVAMTTTPHVQLQSMRLFNLHRPCKRTMKPKTAAWWLTQPDNELQQRVPDVAFHRSRNTWRGCSRAAAASSFTPECHDGQAHVLQHHLVRWILPLCS